jgi:hypothetical protein
MIRVCVQDDAGHFLMHERDDWLGRVGDNLTCDSRETFDAPELTRLSSLHFAIPQTTSLTVLKTHDMYTCPGTVCLYIHQTRRRLADWHKLLGTHDFHLGFVRRKGFRSRNFEDYMCQEAF